MGYVGLVEVVVWQEKNGGILMMRGEYACLYKSRQVAVWGVRRGETYRAMFCIRIHEFAERCGGGYATTGTTFSLLVYFLFGSCVYLVYGDSIRGVYLYF